MWLKKRLGSYYKNICVSKVTKMPAVVNRLTVTFGKNGWARLVLDCRHINACLFKYKFRMEDSSVARHMFKKGDWVFSFDLKSAYHHLEIFEAHRKFLGFSCVFQGKLTYFVFNVLPFGLSTAGFIFTKMLRPVISHWRDQGIKVMF